MWLVREPMANSIGARYTSMPSQPCVMIPRSWSPLPACVPVCLSVCHSVCMLCLPVSHIVCLPSAVYLTSLNESPSKVKLQSTHVTPQQFLHE